MVLHLKTKVHLASAASLMSFFVFAFVAARSAETYTASAINARGQIVGQAFNRGRSRAFLLESGLPPDLATLGGSRSAAQAVSELGVVVGWSIPGEGGVETAQAGVW